MKYQIKLILQEVLPTWFQVIIQKLSNKIRHIYQWKRIEKPKTTPYSYSYLIFDKDAKSVHGRRQYLQQTVMGNLNFNIQKMKPDPYILSCTELNSKWIKDLNTSP